MAASPSSVILGRIAGAHGVKGWVKVFSETQPRQNILSYSPCLVQVAGAWHEMDVLDGRLQGQAVVAQLKGCDDRDQALALKGAVVAVERGQLPAAATGEYYWADLEGLEVITETGVILGEVDHLLETGANDVLVLKPTTGSIDEQERLIPFIREQVIRRIDLDAGQIIVDWDPTYLV